MKYLSEKIPKHTSSKVRINKDLYTYEKIMETAPTLPDFALALKPDEYQLPLVDTSWNDEEANVSTKVLKRTQCLECWKVEKGIKFMICSAASSPASK